MKKIFNVVIKNKNQCKTKQKPKKKKIGNLTLKKKMLQFNVKGDEEFFFQVKNFCDPSVGCSLFLFFFQIYKNSPDVVVFFVKIFNGKHEKKK
jgi:hypothetical protein